MHAHLLYLHLVCPSLREPLMATHRPCPCTETEREGTVLLPPFPATPFRDLEISSHFFPVCPQSRLQDTWCDGVGHRMGQSHHYFSPFPYFSLISPIWIAHTYTLATPQVHLLSFLQELHRLKYKRSERNHSCRRVTRNN